MPRTCEPIPAEIPKKLRAKFSEWRCSRKKRGQDSTVESFNSRRKWSAHGESWGRTPNAPEIKQRMDAMRSVSKAWAVLIDCWDEIEACFMSEVPGWLDGKDEHVSATRTYNLMHERAGVKP
jgi:hypothetical protein